MPVEKIDWQFFFHKTVAKVIIDIKKLSISNQIEITWTQSFCIAAITIVKKEMETKDTQSDFI